MGWLGFLCSGMELAGKPASKQFLAYWFKLRAQPSLKMLVFGMNLAGKFKCNVFPGRLNYQPPLRKIRVHSSSESISREEWTRGRASSQSSVPTCAASYSTAVIWPLCDKWAVNLEWENVAIARALSLSEKVYLQRSTELIGQQGKFPVLSLVCRNCVVLDLLYSSLLYSSGFAVIVTKSDTNYNYALSSCSSSWCAFRLDN